MAEGDLSVITKPVQAVTPTATTAAPAVEENPPAPTPTPDIPQDAVTLQGTGVLDEPPANELPVATPLAAATNPLTPNLLMNGNARNSSAGFIENAYINGLGRNATDTFFDTTYEGGNAGPTYHLNVGTDPRTFTKTVFASSELQAQNLTTEQKVDRLYQTILGRAADPEGRQSWIDNINNGMSVDRVIDEFFNSPEYQTRLATGEMVAPDTKFGGNGTAAPGNPPTTPGAPTLKMGRANVDSRQVSIGQVDIFGPEVQNDGTLFDHGRTVAGFIARASNPGQKTNIVPFDVGDANIKTIGNALENIIAQVDQGRDVDAVNMSLGFFQDSPDAKRVRDLVDQLVQRGVAVDIAAGNDGPAKLNFLATDNAFVIENTTQNPTTNRAFVSPKSGPGNARAPGTTTSFATGTFTGQIAQLINQGMTLDQARLEMARRDVTTFNSGSQGVDVNRIQQTQQTVIPIVKSIFPNITDAQIQDLLNNGKLPA